MAQMRTHLSNGLAICIILAFLAFTAFQFISFNPVLVDERYQAFNLFFLDIKIGMNREQIIAVMNRRYPIDGPRQRPKVIADTPAELTFFMNPESFREPNCEGIFLTLENGRVTQKVYSPD